MSKASYGRSAPVPHWYGKLNENYCSTDLNIFSNFPSSFGLKRTYPESPRFVVFKISFLVVSNFARTAVLDPIFLTFAFTALTRIFLSSLALFSV